MPHYRPIIDSFGRQGVELIDRKGKPRAFVAHSRIFINPRLNLPEIINKLDIPQIKRRAHYRISQCYFYYRKIKNIGDSQGKMPEEVEFSPEDSFRWEREFRWSYYQQYILGKSE